MINVCVVLHNHPSVAMGGAQYQTHLLAEELARQPGTNVTYIARGVDYARCAEQRIPYNVRRIGSNAGIRRRAAFFDAVDLRRALHELRPDVIYQQMKESYTAVCARYAQTAGIPFFFHIASDLDLDPRWIRWGISTNLPFDIVEAVTGTWGLRSASHVIAQTSRQGRVLRERFGRDPVRVVRNFQPLPDALPEKPADGKLRVLWVANFKDVKRPDLFVQLADRFAGRNDIEFLMIGRPSDNRRFQPLMSRIRQTGNLKYLGELPVEQVNEWMARADVHVNTSSYEGFPNTFIQAWAQGAVVMSLAVDPDEGMESMGIGFCTHTVERMAAVIDDLAKNPQRREEIARRAHAFALSHHSMTHGTQLAQLMLTEAQKCLSLKDARPAGG